MMPDVVLDIDNNDTDDSDDDDDDLHDGSRYTAAA